jgi:hypothetical protein
VKRILLAVATHGFLLDCERLTKGVLLGSSGGSTGGGGGSGGLVATELSLSLLEEVHYR